MTRANKLGSSRRPQISISGYHFSPHLAAPVERALQPWYRWDYPARKDKKPEDVSPCGANIWRWERGVFSEKDWGELACEAGENLESTASPNPREERQYVKEEPGIQALKLGLIVDRSIWH